MTNEKIPTVTVDFHKTFTILTSSPIISFLKAQSRSTTKGIKSTRFSIGSVDNDPSDLCNPQSPNTSLNGSNQIFLFKKVQKRIIAKTLRKVELFLKFLTHVSNILLIRFPFFHPCSFT